MHQQRQSGILLHPTSLPGPGGIGSFGIEARHFVDFLRDAGQSLWQILPLGPTGYGNSPYSCYSAFAGNPLLIDLRTLVAEGDLLPEEADDTMPSDRVDYPAVTGHKLTALRRGAERFFATDDRSRKKEFWQFCDSTFWLHDYALFMALKEQFVGKGWNRWPAPLVRREVDACNEQSHLLGHSIGIQKYQQWQFFRQWQGVKRYANEQGIRIIGDAPIFVAYDSADVWCNQHLFRLGQTGKPVVVAGVPPDYFSRTGQRWGNPLYDWDRLAGDGYGWWIARLKSDLGLYDLVRIDHFRGFEAYWEIPATEKTAVKGEWAKGPGEALFHAFREAIGSLPLIAEDLGVITPEVEALRDRFGLPGMKILQFAFDSGADNAYLPHNYCRSSVVYTGTHDNDTTRGWFNGLNERQQGRVCSYLSCSPQEVVWEMIRAALSSVARQAIIPMQDLLELDSSARMNTPGLAEGNWTWRMPEKGLRKGVAGRLAELTSRYNRGDGR